LLPVQHVERAERIEQVVLTDRGAHGVAGAFSGAIGSEQHRSADGIPAEQRSLRTPQDLRGGDIAHLHRATDRAAHVDIVDVQANSGIHRRCGVSLADAADEHLCGGIVAGQRAVAVELQVRRDLVEVRGAGDLHAFEHFTGDHGHGNRRVLQALFAATRRHHDFAEFLDVCRLRAFGRLGGGRTS
jgi:hypothetical protein